MQALYGRALRDRPLLWSGACGGAWLAAAKVLLPDAACLVTPQDAQATEQLNALSSNSSSDSCCGALGPLGMALVQLGLPLLDLPQPLLLMLRKHLVRAAPGQATMLTLFCVELLL